MAELTKRPPALEGKTYKVRWDSTALYVTINNLDGKPYEVFINSKNVAHYAWTVALTRMISAVFRRGGDVSFVAEELRSVFDPRGGEFMGKSMVPSVVALIGGVIERHVEELENADENNVSDRGGV